MYLQATFTFDHDIACMPISMTMRTTFSKHRKEIAGDGIILQPLA